MVPIHSIRYAIFAMCVCGYSLAHAQDEAAPPARRYDAGPLTVDDFQAPIPDPLPRVGRFRQSGLADTDVQFVMRYRYQRVGGQVEATLTRIEVFSVFLSEKSWLALRDARMLDHEQGHFDITQIHALQLNLHLNQQLAAGKPLIGRGNDLPAAEQALHDRIQQSLQPTLARIKTAQLDYDRDTQNGTSAVEQAAQRKRQLELLTGLNGEM